MPYYRISGVGIKSGRNRKAKSYFAKDEKTAIAKARKDGTDPNQVELIEVVSYQFSIVGVTFTNRDGSDRQKILKRIKLGDPLIIQHELDNPRDKHAIRILDKKWKQAGYVPQDIAHEIIEGYYYPGDRDCLFSAVTIEVIPFDDKKGRTLKVQLLIADSKTSQKKIEEYIKENLESKQIPPIQKLTEKAISKRPARSEKNSQPKKFGCVKMIVIAVLLLLLWSIISAWGN